ncbi:ABC transporter permease [Auraticoccus monumenti]|uniref:Carbohydrate ABC transporter membrane protein 1, CUT1 family n=1 Tax=Auraticoccus monumenti TaxID=675864 RepID=A0A1G7AS32_9ACTN|nr:ABC transporter permease subunit [Auraticoccus monumenti]SDE17542.1 carbohydrate ABC transporter membrane protein 1, CUT1 family [Auraticoccus monumenti]
MTLQDPALAPDGSRATGPVEATALATAAERDAPRRRRPRRSTRVPLGTALRRDWQLYSLALLPLVFFLVFRYVPMAGNVIAFRRFQPGGSIFGESWVGLRYVELFLSDPTFWQVLGNTLTLGLLSLAITFPMPIMLALLLNEVRTRAFKGFVQTVSYLPHFLSIVIVAGMVMQLTSLDGTINQVVRALGGEAVPFIQRPEWFRIIYVSSEVWQTVGWGTILYLAVLTTIDPSLYEAARIDGANRWRQTWHVTLTGIRPTMVTLLILNIGTFMAVGFEKILLLYNPLTYPTADVISTYLYRVGLESNNFSYAAAIGMFEAVIGLTLILSANAISRRLLGTSLW